MPRVIPNSKQGKQKRENVKNVINKVKNVFKK